MVRSAFGYIWEHRIIIIFKSYIWVYLGTLAGAWPSIIAVSDSDSPPLMRSARGNRGPPQQTSTKRSLFAENPNCLKFGTFTSLRRCQILPQPCRHLVLIKHHRHIDHRHRKTLTFISSSLRYIHLVVFKHCFIRSQLGVQNGDVTLAVGM